MWNPGMCALLQCLRGIPGHLLADPAAGLLAPGLRLVFARESWASGILVWRTIISPFTHLHTSQASGLLCAGGEMPCVLEHDIASV